ncbi:MAG: ribosome small subunit-dependent GTPase A [Thermoleophilia bacterium]
MVDTRVRLSLEPLGFDDRVEEFFGALVAEGLRIGRVARVDRGKCYLLTAEDPVRAETAPHVHRDPDGLAPPTVGDWVAFQVDGDGHAHIERIIERTSVFTRGDAAHAGVSQILAANVDTVFLVHSLTRALNVRRLERELVLVYESGAMPVIVLNKADLVSEAEAAGAQAEAETAALDRPVHVVSAITSMGLNVLEPYTRGNRTIALVGASGVGKSTLVNRLVGAAVQRIGAVREGDSRGRHTTVARELIVLPGGGCLIDTPGLRTLAIKDAESGFAAAFSDIEALAAVCRFRDCSHRKEPGCAIRDAVEQGTLSPGRLHGYLKLRDELEAVATERVRGERARRERRRR